MNFLDSKTKITRSCALIVVLLSSLAAAQEESEAWQDELLIQNGIAPTAEAAALFLERFRTSPAARQRISELIEQLGSDIFQVRRNATSELREIGEIAESQLFSAAKSSNLERLARARDLLDYMHARRDSGLRDSLLIATLNVLQRNPNKGTAALLIDIIPAFHEGHIRSAATEVLWTNVRASDEDRIRCLLARPESSSRTAAIVALELAAQERAVPELRTFLSDRNEFIRLAAARALIDRRPRECLEALIELVSSENFEVHAHSCQLLRDLTGQKFGKDSSSDFKTVVAEWQSWAKDLTATTPLRNPLGAARLELSRVILVFREQFARDASAITDRYGRFHYESTLKARAYVSKGVLHLDGQHPEADQRLFVSPRDLTGGQEFPSRFRVTAECTGGSAGAGGYHVGLSVGRIKVLFHPDYSGGSFRVETTDGHEYLTSNKPLGFTPDSPVFHKLTLRVNRQPNSKVQLEASVENGEAPHQKFVHTYECASELIGPLNRIGLERSGRTGGDGLFRNITIDFSGL